MWPHISRFAISGDGTTLVGSECTAKIVYKDVSSKCLGMHNLEVDDKGHCVPEQGAKIMWNCVELRDYVETNYSPKVKRSQASPYLSVCKKTK
jgi:hypothetical protein